MKKSLRRWIALACVAVLCALMSGCAFLSGIGSWGEKIEIPQISSVMLDEKMGIIYGEKLFMTEYEGGYTQQSLDGKYGICFTGDTLLYLHDGKVEKIAQQVEKCQISNAGTGVIYQLNEASGQYGALYHYNGLTGETTLVCDNKGKGLLEYVLSPDGQSVVYLYGKHMMVYQNGTSQVRLEPSSGIHLLSTDNSTDVIYYWSRRTIMSVNRAGEETKIGQIQRSTNDSYFIPGWFQINADHTELLFYDASAKSARLSVRGEEGIRIDNVDYLGQGVDMNPMIPALGLQEHQGFVTLNNITSFRGHPMQSKIGFLQPDADGVYGIVAEYSREDSRMTWLDPSGRYFYYTDRDLNFYVIDLHNDGQRTKLAENVNYFAVANDCSVAYYYDDLSDYGGSLCRCDALDGSDVVKIDAEFTQIFMSGSNQLYTLKGTREQADLYKVNSRGKAELVLEDVQFFWRTAHELARYVRCGDDYYILLDGALIKLKKQDLAL